MKKCPNEPALFPPGWLENTVNNPKLAEAEIRYVNIRLREVQAENKEVRSERAHMIMGGLQQSGGTNAKSQAGGNGARGVAHHAV